MLAFAKFAEKIPLFARAALCIAFACLSFQAVAQAQFRDEFESPNHAFKLSGADCGVRVLSQKRTFEQAHAGSSSEHLRFVAGQGTYIYYAYDLGRSPIIEETNISLWLKSDRARLQLAARVVLPRTLDEQTGKPITALLYGSEYGEIGTWQKLQLNELPKLLTRQLVVLRRQHGSHVDAGEAYLDLLVVNAYGGAGETNVWIDDLEVVGVVDSDWAKDVVPRGSGKPDTDALNEKTLTRPAVVEGNVLLVENRPLFVRGIEYRGEPLQMLKALGFNTIVCSTPVSPELNDDAKQLGLWLIAPPPELNGSAGFEKYDRVISWQLGTSLTREQLISTRSLGSEVRRADLLRRPLLCGLQSEAWSYSREAELLLWEMPPLFSGTSFTAGMVALRQKIAQARAGAPNWAVVSLGPAPQLEEQLGWLDRAAPKTVAADFEQARLATLSALAGGTRGLVFRANTRLDGEDEPTQQLAAIMRLLNLELNYIEPWFAGGATPQEINTGDPTLRAAVLQTERSRLVLLLREPPLAQFVTPGIANDAMLVSLPGIPISDRLYHITSDGVKQIDRPPGNGAGRLTIPESGDAAVLAVTQDPLVIAHLMRHSESQRREMVETHTRMVANRLTSTALVGEEIRRTLRPPPEAANLREAQRFLQEADRLLLRGDLTGCHRNTRRVEHLVSQTRRAWWDSARSIFPSPLTSPCCVAFETLPAHVRLGFRLQEATWSRNGVPAGDCERIEQLIATGWKHQRHERAELLTVVELSPASPHGGAASLRLAALAQGKQVAESEEPAITVSTGAIRMKQGQIARVRGFFRVPELLRGSHAGLLIYENMAGPALAERVLHSPAWQEFMFYRAAPHDGELHLTFALYGLGEAFLDDITIELIDAP